MGEFFEGPRRSIFGWGVFVQDERSGSKKKSKDQRSAIQDGKDLGSKNWEKPVTRRGEANGHDLGWGEKPREAGRVGSRISELCNKLFPLFFFAQLFTSFPLFFALFLTARPDQPCKTTLGYKVQQHCIYSLKIDQLRKGLKNRSTENFR